MYAATNKHRFGPVVLEIACNIFIKKASVVNQKITIIKKIKQQILKLSTIDFYKLFKTKWNKLQNG